MRKLSARHFSLYKISKRDNEQNIIKDMKERIKKDPAVIAAFKKYKVPIDKIDSVHVEFSDLDVSAKTKDAKIYLNRKMLESDSDIKDPAHYLAHEITHYLQQVTGNVAGHSDVEDYLDKPTEEEAFRIQVDFKKRNEGEDEAQTYVEELLDHHDIDGKEREEKRDELLEG